MTVKDPTQLIEEGAAAIRLSGPGPRPAGPRRQSFDVIVIGAGQAGLSVGYHLAGAGVRFVILEAHARIGDAWRGRWDSLRLFTPAKFDGLPGMAFPAPRNHFPTKDEMADYLEAYARGFALPVRTGVRVERLFQRGARYVVASGAGEFEAAQVVVAMAKYQQGRCARLRRLPVRTDRAAALAGLPQPGAAAPGGRPARGRGQLRGRHRARGGARRSCDLPFRPRYR